MNAWDRVNEEFACEHTERAVSRKTTKDGRHVYYRQCTRCGDGKVIKKTEALTACGGYAPVSDFNHQLVADWCNRKLERMRQIQREETDQQNAEWWEAYETYLATDKWKRKRSAVLKRDGFICQACLTRRASQCHHLTYKHVFNEPLFELVAVCEVCHDKITALDRAGRQPANA